MTLAEIKQQQLEYLGIAAYHKAGYRGQGITVLNVEEDSGHGATTRDIFELILPEATIFSLALSSRSNNTSAEIFIYKDGVTTPLEQFLIDNKVDIVSASLVGSEPDGPLAAEYRRIRKATGCLFFNAAGNDGYPEPGKESAVKTKFPYADSITVAALYFNLEKYGVKHALYSSVGKEVEFAYPTFGRSGTSYSAPGLAAASGLVRQRYGKMEQEEMIEFLKGISVDIDEEGFDMQTGYGIPILPDSGQRVITMTIDKPEINVDGRVVELDVAPFIKDNRTFLPVRALAEILGCRVEWVEATRQVVITDV